MDEESQAGFKSEVEGEEREIRGCPSARVGAGWMEVSSVRR